MDDEFTKQVSLAESFIASYLASRDGLSKMGIIRSGRALQSEYAEWLAAKYLSLTLAESTVQKAYDAIDHIGRTYQIKSRTVKRLTKTTAFHLGPSIHTFDFLVCVFLSPNMKLLGIVEIPHDAVVQLATKNRSGYRFRWNKTVANDPGVNKRFWVSEE